MSDLWWLSCETCGGDFLACGDCGRVRRYCSDDCAAQGLEEARRRARRTYQSSEEGRLDHRDRQREYRARRRRRVMDNSAAELPVARSVCSDDARHDHSHDSSHPHGDDASGPAGRRRDDDRSAGAAHVGTPSRAVQAHRGTGALVPDAAPRCALCGKRGDRVIDRPRRWPWSRRVDAPVRCRPTRGPTSPRSAPPRRSRRVRPPP